MNFAISVRSARIRDKDKKQLFQQSAEEQALRDFYDRLWRLICYECFERFCGEDGSAVL